MTRAPTEETPIHITAEVDYSKGMKYKDIATKYNVSINTVKSWKTRYEWIKGMHTKKEKVCTQKIDAVKMVIENKDMNDKQRLFCLHYSKSFNATRSYQKAYGCSYESALRAGPELLGNLGVREQIMKLKEERYSKALLKPDDIFQKYMDIAYADITDFATFGVKEFSYFEDGVEHIESRQYVETTESSEVDGTLITEISKGRDGIKIKLADKMKALDWLTAHMNMATDRQIAEIALINKRAEVGQTTDNTLMQSLIDLIDSEDADNDGME